MLISEYCEKHSIELTDKLKEVLFRVLIDNLKEESQVFTKHKTHIMNHLDLNEDDMEYMFDMSFKYLKNAAFL